MKDLTKFIIGSHIKCNTIGHHTAGLIGNITRLCNTMEDKLKGWGESYAVIDYNELNRVNLNNCELISDVTVELSNTEMRAIKSAVSCYISEAGITEDNESWEMLISIKAKMSYNLDKQLLLADQ